jgi:thioredoxin reductase (NADPH)
VNLFDSDETFPRLSPELLVVLDAAGERRPISEGEVLYRAGDRSTEFFVVVSGLVAGIDGFGTADERELGVFGERRFGGELGLMTGQPAVLTGVVREAGEAIVLSRDALKEVIAEHQQLGDLLLSTFLARRAALIGLGSGVRLIGSHLSPDSRRLRELLRATASRTRSWTSRPTSTPTSCCASCRFRHATPQSCCAGRLRCATRATARSPTR